MDVRLVSNIINPASISSDNTVANSGLSGGRNEIVASEQMFKNSDAAIQEKVMMDLKDVQQFLYMLIGSEILIDSGDKGLGLTVNKQA